MYKLAAVALSAALGVTGVVQSTTAEAHPTLTVGIGLPGVAVEPFGYAPAYYAPYAPGLYCWHGRYWRRDYDRDRYEHFHHRWDHDGDHRWERR